MDVVESRRRPSRSVVAERSNLWASRYHNVAFFRQRVQYMPRLYKHFRTIEIDKRDDTRRRVPFERGKRHATHQERSRGFRKGSIEDRRAHRRRRLVRSEHKKAAKRRVTDAGKNLLTGLLNPGVTTLARQRKRQTPKKREADIFDDGFLTCSKPQELIASGGDFGTSGPTYGNYETCSWKIEVSDNKRLRLHFSSFNLESHPQCRYDSAKVYDGSSESLRRKQ
ncbi:hypothetical protein LSAT2_015589 [Lamellibrachia satsuma]|nr:hypothetical protein LSAT2_015589 [Lamellibrachia satsuma]